MQVEAQKKPQLPALLLACLCMLALGCSDAGGDVQVVDFSQTITVNQPKAAAPDAEVLRLAVGAMISPKETFVSYSKLLEYLGRQVGRQAVLVQRKTYGEINDLFARGQVDLGFICSGPYAIGRERYHFQLLATPLVQGSPTYQAYLIVQREGPYRTLEDLRGRTFAFTDPDSNTGRLVPLYWLAEIGQRPEQFFAKVIYTYSHDNSIIAVARGLVDGASVDSLIWEYYAQHQPALTGRTRIIRRSEPYGIPPLVAYRDLEPGLKARLQRAVLEMHRDPEGRRILDHLLIDRFVVPREEWYDSIREMYQKLPSGLEGIHASHQS